MHCNSVPGGGSGENDVTHGKRLFEIGNFPSAMTAVVRRKGGLPYASRVAPDTRTTHSCRPARLAARLPERSSVATVSPRANRLRRFSGCAARRRAGRSGTAAAKPQCELHLPSSKARSRQPPPQIGPAPHIPTRRQGPLPRHRRHRRDKFTGKGFPEIREMERGERSRETRRNHPRVDDRPSTPTLLPGRTGQAASRVFVLQAGETGCGTATGSRLVRRHFVHDRAMATAYARKPNVEPASQTSTNATSSSAITRPATSTTASIRISETCTSVPQAWSGHLSRS